MMLRLVIKCCDPNALQSVPKKIILLIIIPMSSLKTTPTSFPGHVQIVPTSYSQAMSKLYQPHIPRPCPNCTNLIFPGHVQIVPTSYSQAMSKLYQPHIPRPCPNCTNLIFPGHVQMVPTCTYLVPGPCPMVLTSFPG